MRFYSFIVSASFFMGCLSSQAADKVSSCLSEDEKTQFQAIVNNPNVEIKMEFPRMESVEIYYEQEVNNMPIANHNGPARLFGPEVRQNNVTSYKTIKQSMTQPHGSFKKQGKVLKNIPESMKWTLNGLEFNAAYCIYPISYNTRTRTSYLVIASNEAIRKILHGFVLTQNEKQVFSLSFEKIN